MLHSRFTVAPFEQSPYAYRSGLVEIKAHMDFQNNLLTYSYVKGYRRNKEIENFLWAFKDFFGNKRDVNRYCCSKTFVRKTRTCRTYGVVFEGKAFKYNVRIDNNTDKNAVNYFIVINRIFT